MTKFYLFFISHFLLLVACSNSITDDSDKSVQSVPEKINSIDNSREVISSSDSLNELISDVATSFHDWYIAISNSEDNSIPTSAEIIEDENGKCKMDNNPYFVELRKIGTISEKFIQSELERTKECAEFMSTIDWLEYQNSEGYTYAENCPQFYYQYWTRSQDVYSGVVVDNIEKDASKWMVTLVFYYNDGNKRYFDKNNQPKVTVENEAGKWMITNIGWVKDE